MNIIENSVQIQNIKTFLTTSRQYFSLPPVKTKSTQQTLLSIMTSRLKANHVTAYRKLIQSLLLVAGVGAFATAPAMAAQGCGHMGGHSERHSKMMEQHHNQLHDALKLTAEQEPAWKKLMESEQQKQNTQGGQVEDWAKLNAPERAEKMLEISKSRQVQIAEHVAALKAFYAVLSAEQQKTFEEFHSNPRGGMNKSGPKASSTSKVTSKP